jgi:hypothetical protein
MNNTRKKQRRTISRKLWKKYPARLTGKFIKTIISVCIVMAAIKINRKAFYELMHQLSSRPAERGGILLGPVGTNYITHFYFDRGGICTPGTYSPDCVTLNRKLRQLWRPAGLEIKGIAHSHKGNLDSLTAGDMSYIKRLLSRNPHMNTFIAPVVLPNQYKIQPFIISRDRMDYAQRANFEFYN